MRILLVHNYYGSSAPSGENVVVDAERALLRSRGHEVVDYIRHSDDVRRHGARGAAVAAAGLCWNPFAVRTVARIIERERPDVMHVHNTFPLISPAVFSAARQSEVATILTLHNYRLFCASGVITRDNIPCTACLDRKSVVPGLLHACYRGSRVATLPMSAMIALHRWMKTWHEHVDAFIALTEFQKRKVIGAGLPSNRVFVKPHFYDNPPQPRPWSVRDDKVVYVGRLDAFKGVRYLVEAWRQWGDAAPKLEIVGDGPDRDMLARMVQHIPGGRVRLLGRLRFDETQDRVAGARLLVLPSVSMEGFPMVIREAYALGVPVAASMIGPLEAIVEDGRTGVLFPPRDPDAMLAAIRRVWGSKDKLSLMAAGARARFEAEYTSDRNHALLMDIYARARAMRSAKAC